MGSVAEPSLQRWACLRPLVLYFKDAVLCFAGSAAGFMAWALPAHHTPASEGALLTAACCPGSSHFSREDLGSSERVVLSGRAT